MQSFWFSNPFLTPVILGIKGLAGRSSGIRFVMFQFLVGLMITIVFLPFHSRAVICMILALMTMLDMIYSYWLNKVEKHILHILGMGPRQSLVMEFTEGFLLFLIFLSGMGIAMILLNVSSG